ncbi:[FeFe] hydrogenase H-cluster maturation GTPase HydF [Paludicola sp. MB14-C6]|uniref:[FeFe] hydrogenase H-cluster maturation GTPase HydF n=1 Tax=Paludihabitans sp. MB14-C6 TaxID=3070656 RepID=UPI0027DB024B|nr:[FeFe] hydrogenase H-cluster maturation GTPase HydF [Paludicola sp. MB14-C6]WMJ23556.1 [FeFe] hydrogenase H-cluster maturation GTPase HydF [Paludicola sp. MB14-C6]
MSLNNTPSANRLHIGIFGKRNSGKSSLINALTNQDVALVSNIAGTTTDPVYKAMEVRGIGACTFIDTAGFDDEGDLGKLRIDKTKQAVLKTEIAILVFTNVETAIEYEWYLLLKEHNIPVIAVINKADCLKNIEIISQTIKEQFELNPIIVSSVNRNGIDEVLIELVRNVPESFNNDSITKHLVNQGDVVMLVMPQDSEAPKGRLILPQVQTTRDLLDNQCIIISVTPEQMPNAIHSLKEPPKLIITDSQAFQAVYKMTPKESKLTSFSVLFAAHKGDLPTFIDGANAIDKLNANSKVLIAEACTHAPLSEDIGRVKIPMLLRKKYGQSLQIDIVSGVDFPDDVTAYDLIVHCGGCMFNKKYLLSRIERAKSSGVPITNYGVLLAKLNGILDKITM